MLFLFFLLFFIETFCAASGSSWPWPFNSDSTTTDTITAPIYPSGEIKCSTMLTDCENKSSKTFKCFGDNSEGSYYRRASSGSIVCDINPLLDCSNLCDSTLRPTILTSTSAFSEIWWAFLIVVVILTIPILGLGGYIIYTCFCTQPTSKNRSNGGRESNSPGSDDDEIIDEGPLGGSGDLKTIASLQKKLKSKEKKFKEYQLEKRDRISNQKRQIRALKDVKKKLMLAIKEAKSTIDIIRPKLDKYRKENARLREQMESGGDNSSDEPSMQDQMMDYESGQYDRYKYDPDSDTTPGGSSTPYGGESSY